MLCHLWTTGLQSCSSPILYSEKSLHKLVPHIFACFSTVTPLIHPSLQTSLPHEINIPYLLMAMSLSICQFTISYCLCCFNVYAFFKMQLKCYLLSESPSSSHLPPQRQQIFLPYYLSFLYRLYLQQSLYFATIICIIYLCHYILRL